MGVYIDRDELLELYANTDGLDISNYDVKVVVIRQNILDMPTIDIVRCKDCEYWDGIECQNDRASTDLEGGAEYALYRDDTDFCSYGERKE